MLLSLSGGVAAALLALFSLLSFKSWSDLLKKSPFECGFRPVSKLKPPFSLQFFLITLIFLIFDIEVVLLFPYAVSTSTRWHLGRILYGFIVTALTVGFAWEWAQAILE